MSCQRTQAGAVDEERAVQRLLLEVVVAAIGLEGVERAVGHSGNGNGPLLVVLDRLLQARGSSLLMATI